MYFSMNFLVMLCFVLNEAILMNACFKSSQSMHRCLHVFLERDFYLVQDLFRFEPRDFNQGRFLLEGMELKKLCTNIKEMENCYYDHLSECFAFPFHLNLLRIVNSIRSVHHVLCGNGTDALKELITNGYCIERFRRNNYACDHGFSNHYPLIFIKLMRFEIGGYSICDPLIKYRECMIEPLLENCDKYSMKIWNLTLNSVINGFCFKHQFHSRSNLPKLDLIILLSLILIYSFFF